MRSARSTRTVSLFTRAAPIALVAALAGCSGESGTAGASGTTGTVRAADSVAPEQSANGGDAGPDHARSPHHGGPDFLLGAALHEPIDLTADQRRTIEGLREANKPSGPHPFDKARASALAAGVRAGKVDTTAVAPAPDDAVAARRTALANALATLHATLTPKQRRALVDALAAHSKDDVANGPGPGHAPHAGGPPPGDGGPMGHLLEGLDVTAAQQQAIRAKLDAERPAPPSDAEREAMHAAMQAKLETFAGDPFDATAFVSPPAGATKPGDHPDRFLTDLAAVTSVLDKAQREKLAARIEAGPPAPAADQAPSR